MAIARADAVTMILNELGESDSATETLVGQALDLAQRDVARAYTWPELYVPQAFVNTSDDYSTGTVELTNGDATVTLTGGTFPTTVVTALYRFALSPTSQWYGITTRTDGTHVELSQAYVGTTDTSTTYTLYRNVIAMTSADRVESVILHDGTRAVELQYVPSQQWVMEFGHFPSGLGVPYYWTDFGRDSSGNVLILIGPEAPDAEYRLEYAYRARTTDGSFSLSEPLLDLVIARAQALVYRRDHFQRYLALNREYERMLAQEIARAGDAPGGFTLGAGRLIGTDNYLQNLMRFGTVES